MDERMNSSGTTGAPGAAGVPPPVPPPVPPRLPPRQAAPPPAPKPLPSPPWWRIVAPCLWPATILLTLGWALWAGLAVVFSNPPPADPPVSVTSREAPR